MMFRRAWRRSLFWATIVQILFAVVASPWFVTATKGSGSPSAGAQLDDAQASAVLERFISETPPDAQFYIQGWRWHTMALIRESRRFQRLAESLRGSCVSEETLASIHRAADHIVNFNMKGLHKIERDLFYPWVRTRVKLSNQGEVVSAVEKLMDHLGSEQMAISQLGEWIMGETTSVAMSLSTSDEQRVKAFDNLTSQAATIADRAHSMLQIEDKFLIPTIALIVPAQEQKKFNDKVIRKLGILDSRLHLVGMHEAVQALNDENESKLFEDSIPSLPRRMIPRWKRNLYDPKLGILEIYDK